MSDNQQYLEEHGLPYRLVFKDGCLGEWIGPGAFRNLISISECYGEYVEAIAKEIIKRYNPAPVFQLHWEFDNHTEMKSQACPEEMLHGNPHSRAQTEMRKWTCDVHQRYPLPEGARWLMVNEDSEYFVWPAEPVQV